MAAKKKSSFYRARWDHVGLTVERAAEVLGTDAETVRQWDIEGAPVMAERLLYLWDSKNVGIEGWEGWKFSRGVLIYKGHRWGPQALLRWHDSCRQVIRLENELRQLTTWRGLFTKLVDKAINDTRRHLVRRGMRSD